MKGDTKKKPPTANKSAVNNNNTKPLNSKLSTANPKQIKGLHQAKRKIDKSQIGTKTFLLLIYNVKYLFCGIQGQTFMI